MGDKVIVTDNDPWMNARDGGVVEMLQRLSVSLVPNDMNDDATGTVGSADEPSKDLQDSLAEFLPTKAD